MRKASVCIIHLIARLCHHTVLRILNYALM
jgi:hypothetical protein